MKRHTPTSILASTAVAYRGYLITPLLTAGVVVSKGGSHISYAANIEAAKRIVEELT